MSQLTQAIQAISNTLSGNPSPNDPPTKSGPPTPQDLGFCKTNPNNCQYVACLATNYQNSPQAANVKAGSIVISDPTLRQAVINDPTISKAACAKANLTDVGCKNFKNFLGIVNVFDPASAHVDDEPRDKRSPYDDYENIKPPPKPAEPSSASKSNTKPPPYKPQDCEAIKREVIRQQQKQTANKPNPNQGGGLFGLGGGKGGLLGGGGGAAAKAKGKGGKSRR